MPVQIWDQGRAVGYSAYEIYVKQHLSEHPDEPVATEREWLAASIGSGSSMILSLPQLSGVGKDELTYIDIQLPENSVLVAANTIVASFFPGSISGTAATCYKNGSASSSLTGGVWATKITKYSPLISNTSSSHPDGYVGTSGSIPVDSDSLQMSDDTISKLEDYMQILDGVVIQPGYWTNESSSSVPYSDFSPQLYSKIDGTSVEYVVPRIRLLVKGTLVNSANILLTGFTIRSVVSGISREDGSIDPTDAGRHPENGDFLGPDVFPWANKIVFSVPMGYIQEFLNNTVYVRKLQSDLDEIDVKSTSVIDMSSDSASDGVIYTAPVLEHYYNTQYPETAEYDMKMFPGSTEDTIESVKRSARISNSVNDFWTLGDGTCVLTVYQKSVKYPPALYGTFVTHEGDNYLHPVDIVAPGSVKIFNGADEEDMQYYQNTFPGTTAVNINNNNKFEIIDRETGKKVSPYTESDLINNFILLGHVFQVNHMIDSIKNPVYMYSKPDTRSEKVSSESLTVDTNYYNIESFRTLGTDSDNEPETKGWWLHVRGVVGGSTREGWVRLNEDGSTNFENFSMIPFYAGPKYLACIDTVYNAIDQLTIIRNMNMIVNPEYANISSTSGKEITIMSSTHTASGVTYDDKFIGSEDYNHTSQVHWKPTLFSKLYGYSAVEKRYMVGSQVVDRFATDVNSSSGRSALSSMYPKVATDNNRWLVRLDDSGNIPNTMLNQENKTSVLHVLAGTQIYDSPTGIRIATTTRNMDVFSDSPFGCFEVGDRIWIYTRSDLTKYYLVKDASTGYSREFETVEATWCNYPLNGQYISGHVTSQHIRKVVVGENENEENFLGLAFDSGINGNMKGYQKSIQYSYESLVSPASDDNENYSVISAEQDYRGNNNISWNLLLSALGGDYAIDILQARLKSIQKSLIRSMSTGTGPYIEFGPASNPIRLYISKNEPETDDVPVGSIGIGWGFNN